MKLAKYGKKFRLAKKLRNRQWDTCRADFWFVEAALDFVFGVPALNFVVTPAICWS